jgi:hypothetical protein
MNNQIEQLLIKKFVIKDKQERYLNFLSKEKTRKKFTSELYHFRDFKWNLFREIPSSESESNTIVTKVKSIKNISSCYVVSVNSEFDGKVISLEEAVENVVGEEGTILIFGEAEIIYYEGEAPIRRYVSI